MVQCEPSFWFFLGVCSGVRAALTLTLTAVVAQCPRATCCLAPSPTSGGPGRWRAKACSTGATAARTHNDSDIILDKNRFHFPCPSSSPYNAPSRVVSCTPLDMLSNTAIFFPDAWLRMTVLHSISNALCLMPVLVRTLVGAVIPGPPRFLRTSHPWRP